MSPGLPLQGCRVLVTRPAHQAEGLCALIDQAGGDAIRAPALEIAPPADAGPVTALVARLASYHLAVFISVNAVREGFKFIAACGGVPPGLRLAAVGAGTATALAATAGRVADIQAPPPHNSEALLACAGLHDMAGQRVVIFRGAGGRELLAETLRTRGATVDYAEVYRRAPPRATLAEMLPPARRDTVDVIVVTSNEALDNLVAMSQGENRGWLLRAALVVISPRTAARATELGFVQPAVVARAASDDALLDALVAWRAGCAH